VVLLFILVEDNAVLRLAFLAEESTRVLVRAALTMETLAAAAVTTAEVLFWDNLRFLAALR
jgi:hypothetical protein